MSNINSDFTITNVSSEFDSVSGSIPIFLHVPGANLRQRKTPLSSSVESTSTWFPSSSPWVHKISGSIQDEEEE